MSDHYPKHEAQIVADYLKWKSNDATSRLLRIDNDGLCLSHPEDKIEGFLTVTLNRREKIYISLLVRQNEER